MALGHNDQCGCVDCKLAASGNLAGGGGAYEMRDPHLAGLLAAEQSLRAAEGASAGGDTTAAPSAAIAEVPGPMPDGLLGMVLVDLATIKGGLINVAVLRDPVTLHECALYWERNAETSGRGEWAVVKWPHTESGAV